MTRRNRIKALALTAFSIFILAGCNQNITLGTRSMTDSLPVVTIPGAAFRSDLALSLGLAINSNILGIEADSQFLTFARLRELRLNILESSNTDAIEDGALDNFDFLIGLSVSIRALLNGVEQEEIIAFLPDGDPQFGTAAQSLDLTVVGTDVLDYLQASGGYELILNITGNIPPDAIILSGAVRYRIGVGF